MGNTYAQLRNELDHFLTEHLGGLENAERVEALGWYCQGLGFEIPDKSIYGIATRIAPNAVESVRQRMQRAIQRSRFEHEEVFGRLQRTVFENSDRYAAYCVDDTGVEKKGEFSVGVQRQYSGTLGKVGNCQIAVSLHAVNDDFSACIGAQLYLPREWTENEERLARARVPQDIGFKAKTQLAIELLRAAKANGAPARPVVSDAGYGDSRDFRDAVTKLGWQYAVAISSNTNVWPPEANPQRPPAGPRGRPPVRDRDPGGLEPVRVDQLAQQLWKDGQFKEVRWRTGSNGPLKAQFCAIRVRSAERRTKGKSASEPIWLLLERDEAKGSGFRYYLSSLPKTASIKRIARLAKMRWRIERDYQDMKQQLGLDKYEGRQWGGFHRHFAMVALMHAFLSLHRESFSPCGEDESMDVARLLPRFA